MQEILADHDYASGDFVFQLYLLTGGLPKYHDLLLSNGVRNWEDAIDWVFSAHSPLLDEGKSLLIKEFGKDYGKYFSILELIAAGKTSRPENESILECETGGYIARLADVYGLLTPVRPINVKSGGRRQKYAIVDPFLKFWFRFIWPHRSAVETGNFDYLKACYERDYSTYAGKLLEDFYHEFFRETKQFNKIGCYWEKGNQNEIDLVAINDMENRIILAEIKLKRKEMSTAQLAHKATCLIKDQNSPR